MFLIALACLACSGAQAITVEVTIRIIKAKGDESEFILTQTGGRLFRTSALKKRGVRRCKWDIGTLTSDVWYY